MKIDWKKVENKFDEIDNATYGLAEFALVGGVGSILVICLYCLCSASIWGYVQIWNLITA